ncbi:MAG: transcription termination factor NusA [Candidatus Magasanikbacteria bacterium RIFOXYC2_FULL_42_28]|uniref:Transcription termination/antitermination protein NusA n=1 Tax=Candidatus Magasanikbacteria bacterium RIFOXYC2_FULL_42_28 TaxID=1798704 RepID=A0A1F6NUS7_9BACT|nr:MAG: transcription termination factor NusA [Candidatus Magasanikbacteria bacterium RIFOXYC2_FULL_42_28]
MSSEITKAIQALCDEKNLSYEAVLETVETALAAAYRKDFGNKQQNIKVKFDPETGAIKAWDVKSVVADVAEDVLEKAQEEAAARREKAREEDREITPEELEDLPRFNPKLELMLTAAKEVDKKAKVGDILEIKLEVGGEFGRMAAQTAKQVIIQKIREAERGLVFEDFKKQENTIISGTVQRVEARKILIDLGKITGILPNEEQIRREHYRPGVRMKFFVLKVEMSVRGPEIILSRASSKMVEEIFRQEIPEIESGSVEIKGVARDAGWRSKVAVATSDQTIDPIGSCIGQRGSRINTIIEELGGEKIDIIAWSENPAEYIVKALAPAKTAEVELDEASKVAKAHVPTEQFSMAIGKSGQNVRLASQLTGWRIDVMEKGGEQVVSSEDAPVEDVEEVVVEEDNKEETK